MSPGGLDLTTNGIHTFPSKNIKTKVTDSFCLLIHLSISLCLPPFTTKTRLHIRQKKRPEGNTHRQYKELVSEGLCTNIQGMKECYVHPATSWLLRKVIKPKARYGIRLYHNDTLTSRRDKRDNGGRQTINNFLSDI